MKLSADYNYSPIPPELERLKSDIDGEGIFVTDNFSKLNNIITHVVVRSLGLVSRTPVGGYLNHSENPNCTLIMSDGNYDVEIYCIKLLRDVVKEEELTLDYEIEIKKLGI